MKRHKTEWAAVWMQIRLSSASWSLLAQILAPNDVTSSGWVFGFLCSTIELVVQNALSAQKD